MQTQRKTAWERLSCEWHSVYLVGRGPQTKERVLGLFLQCQSRHWSSKCLQSEKVLACCTGQRAHAQNKLFLLALPSIYTVISNAIHVINAPWPSPSVFVHCKPSTADWNSEDPGKMLENEVSPSSNNYDFLAWVHLKSRAEFLAFISTICAKPLPEATSTTVYNHLFYLWAACHCLS